MAIKTLYTAVGRFERRTNGCNRSCPIILLGGQEYMVDMQEMVIWSMLNWRILRWDDIAGTIAGDNTIFIAVKEGADANELIRRFQTLLKV